MSITLSFPFDTPSNYTYDNTKIDISGGKASLKDLTPANSIFYVSFTTDENANWADGTLTGTLSGGASVSGGALELSGTANCDWSNDNITTLLQTGCIRLRYQPHFTGSAPAVQTLFWANNNTQNRIMIRHNSGLLQAYVYNSAAAVICNLNTVFTVTAEQIYEIELNFDATGGTHRLFIDGVLKDTDTGAGTHGACNNFVRCGGDGSGYNSAILDLLIYDAVQHTTNYTPDWTGIPECKYCTSNPTVICNTTFRSDELEGFTETAVKNGTSELKYNISKGGVYYYWDGSQWSAADGTYSQSSTATEVETNKATFTDAATICQVKIFFHSGTCATAELDTLTINYSYGGETPDTINTCIVWCHQLDGNGNGSTETLTVELNKNLAQYKTGTAIKHERITVTPDATGYWDVELIETVNMESDSKYVFKFANGEQYEKSVPNEATKNFWDLT